MSLLHICNGLAFSLLGLLVWLSERKNLDCCRGGCFFFFFPKCSTFWCNALSKERRNDHHRQSKYLWGSVHTIEKSERKNPNYCRGGHFLSFLWYTLVMHERRRGNDHHQQSKYLWQSVHHILPKYQRGRIPIVVMGVASRSLMSARYFDEMHSGMKGGANITDGWIYPRGIAHHIHHMRWEFSRKTWQTESQPVLNSDLCVEFLLIAIDL